MPREASGCPCFHPGGCDMLAGVRSTEPGWTENEIGYNGLPSRVSLVDSTGMTYSTWDVWRYVRGVTPYVEQWGNEITKAVDVSAQSASPDFSTIAEPKIRDWCERHDREQHDR